MSHRRLQLSLWLIAIPFLALLAVHGLFWALVDATGTNSRNELVPVVIAVGVTVAGVIVGVRALARRAGNTPHAALGWGLASAAATFGIYAVIAVGFLATHADLVG